MVPALLTPLSADLEVLPRFTVGRVFTDWGIDPIPFVVTVWAVGLYVLGVVVLHRRGDRWPVGRTLAFVALGAAALAAFDVSVPAGDLVVGVAVVALVAALPIALSGLGTGQAAFVVLFAMANSGLPGTSGFVGEFMVIVASFQKHPMIAFAAATTLIIGAAYTLWLVKRTIWGEVGNAHVAELEDINPREALVLGVFAAGVLILGIWPKPLTDLMEPAIANLATQIAASKL